jgi:prolyl oligopeptidase
MQPEDPHVWLEDIHGEAAIAWVHARNADSAQALTTDPNFAPLQQQILEVLNAQDRIPHVARRGDALYNFWQDEAHPRGLWRRTSWAQFQTAAPKWEIVLDLDALAIAENENWVWGGATCLGPDYEMGLLSLSRGGGDAKVVREFNTRTKQFVANGFTLPEAKSDLVWIDANTVYVSTDFGPGSLTDSGYPRIIKRWQRGTPLSQAATVFEGQTHDVMVGVSVDATPGFERTLFSRSLDFYHQEHFLLQSDQLVKLDIPADASPSFMRETLLLSLRSDWAPNPASAPFPSGALLYTHAAAYLAGARQLRALFTPTASCSLAGYTTTRSHILLTTLDHVVGRVEQWQKQGEHFVRQPLDTPTRLGSLGVSSLHDPLLASDALGDNYWLTYTDFLTPDALMLGCTDGRAPQTIKSRLAQFDSSAHHIEQRFTPSIDGTRIPYFLIRRQDLCCDGNNPTLLYGYGGFESALTPWYSGVMGRAWLARGGVLAVANIRGGDEYGPGWHQSAILSHKQRSYDDFAAVAQDLIAQKITSPKHLGCMGGSNGGLLVGAVMVQRPELFQAVVCQVPLLDMRRYHTLLAGASWMAEYGNPDDPAHWEFIQHYSPYHNLQADKRYPKILFTTSTRDDRVHPGHARKMAAKMLAMGHACLYYENTEGGHGGAANNSQRAHLQALEYTYLWQQLRGQ